MEIPGPSLDETTFRTGAGVVERARLESECAGNGTEGSNPSLSAIFRRRRTIPPLQAGRGMRTQFERADRPQAIDFFPGAKR